MTATSSPATAKTETRTSPDSVALARAAGVGPVAYLRSRGFVQDVTDEAGLEAAFAAGPVTVYQGFDPSASSLHIGNLLGIMMLGTLQRFGHRPIALGGGGTMLVGDPSGKTSTRSLLTAEAIEENLRGVLPQFGRFLDFEGGRFGANPAALLLNNADWLVHIGYIAFLRDIGRHFSVNEMLAAETYKVRLETTGLNFVEFNYRLVQAYDFLHLFRELDCRLQLGGSDQWGNIVAGVDLVRRADGGKAFGLVCPLLTTASGKKMGKSEGNSVWLEPSLTSPYEFSQYWVNVEDAEVDRLLRLYTFVPDDRIAELTNVSGAALREAKRVLAHEVTALVHGEAAAHEAEDAARRLFGRTSPSTGDAAVPTTEVATADVEGGLTLADLLIRTGLVTSRGEARRLATQGGLSVDDQRVTDVDAAFRPDGGEALVRAGKKRFRRIVVTD
ncbi:MAG: Tyrosyl-tRNA synthetase [uncultured Thermomicrobiales bacterium]|uniref:Tyrosine--tRNA ligase n=1 Tax=uncultured Thermomicrobiales bacterium TaxID=1645740 RepID=A0A6J4URC0_9BACT|nr:MAG: Tyrosyl-tRNA synthetase [uncultured Thermomicrobiales bacterium]